MATGLDSIFLEGRRQLITSQKMGVAVLLPRRLPTTSSSPLIKNIFFPACHVVVTEVLTANPFFIIDFAENPRATPSEGLIFVTNH